MCQAQNDSVFSSEPNQGRKPTPGGVGINSFILVSLICLKPLENLFLFRLEVMSTLSGGFAEAHFPAESATVGITREIISERWEE